VVTRSTRALSIGWCAASGLPCDPFVRHQELSVSNVPSHTARIGAGLRATGIGRALAVVSTVSGCSDDGPDTFREAQPIEVDVHAEATAHIGGPWTSSWWTRTAMSASRVDCRQAGEVMVTITYTGASAGCSGRTAPRRERRASAQHRLRSGKGRPASRRCRRPRDELAEDHTSKGTNVYFRACRLTVRPGSKAASPSDDTAPCTRGESGQRAVVAVAARPRRPGRHRGGKRDGSARPGRHQCRSAAHRTWVQRQRRAIQWIHTGYLLALVALILLGGALGDRYGRRRVFIVGPTWFAAASLLCGSAPHVEVLIVARLHQGVGAALLTPGEPGNPAG
jgi:hypothetical protein